MISDAQLLEIVLHDLQKEFGRKIILSPKDLAPILGVSESSQANMRSSGAFPLPILKQGSKVGVSIYSLAKWLIEGDVSGLPLIEETDPNPVIEPCFCFLNILVKKSMILIIFIKFTFKILSILFFKLSNSSFS